MPLAGVIHGSSADNNNQLKKPINQSITVQKCTSRKSKLNASEVCFFYAVRVSLSVAKRIHFRIKKNNCI
jgi:hypothetical protein